MHDNVKEDEAIGIFISPKLYALRGPNTGVEKIKARGLMRWMIEDKQGYSERR